MVKPQLLLVFLLYLLYRRAWRTLVAFGVISTGIYLITALVSGPDWPLVYLATVRWVNSRKDLGVSGERMYNLDGLLVRLGVSETLLLPLTIITLAALVYVWWRSDHRIKGDNTPTLLITNLELQLAAASLATALTSIYLFPHDLTILIFSGAVLLGWAAQSGWPVWLVGLLFVGLASSLSLFKGRPVDTVFILWMIITLIASFLIMLNPEVKAPTKTPQMLD